MKLLIFTQTVDRNDPLLGFFHTWIEVLAAHYETIIVICLKKGEYVLPDTVSVYSLGKEEGRSRLTYIIRFFWYVVHFRHEYDGIFVHMNHIYVLLGGLLWRIWDKRICLWSNHYAGTIWTNVAARLAYVICYTSTFSYLAKSSNAIRMPVGVDTFLFHENSHVGRKPHSILLIGRIAASKRIDLIVEALGVLKAQGVIFTASIVGRTQDRDIPYHDRLVMRVHELGLDSVVSFVSGVSHDKLPSIYQAHEICINASPSGMFDKTMFESIACGCLLVYASNDMHEMMRDSFWFDGTSPEQLAAAIKKALLLSDENRKSQMTTYRMLVSSNSLEVLATKITSLLMHGT